MPTKVKVLAEESKLPVKPFPETPKGSKLSLSDKHVAHTSGDTQSDIPLITQFVVYFPFVILGIAGFVADCIDKFLGRDLGAKPPPKGYAPLTRDMEQFFRRRVYARMDWCFNRPVAGPAGGRMQVFERQYDEDHILKATGKMLECVNLSSYNYLGFAEAGGETEAPVLKSIDDRGISMCSPAYAGGTSEEHAELEQEVATFLDVEAAMCFGMGWGTNSTAIPALVANNDGFKQRRRDIGRTIVKNTCGRGTLIISDALNHNSIVVGARSSGATIKTFKHNNPISLEKVLRSAIVSGQPKTHRAWRKIIIIIEGVYSMEGEICALREIIALKKKYKAYLYVDEAHSIGAVGENGRGVCELLQCCTRDVDLLMGTFTKSFGAIGGYVAGKLDIIQAMRAQCASHLHSAGLSPACVSQVRNALKIIQTDDGRKRMKRLLENADLMREKLCTGNLHVIGDPGNAVIPVILSSPTKLEVFSNYCLQHGVAVVIVGPPATPMLLGRVRFCMSSAHTPEDIEHAAGVVIEAAELCGANYFTKSNATKKHGAAAVRVMDTLFSVGFTFCVCMFAFSAMIVHAKYYSE